MSWTRVDHQGSLGPFSTGLVGYMFERRIEAPIAYDHFGSYLVLVPDGARARIFAEVESLEMAEALARALTMSGRDDTKGALR